MKAQDKAYSTGISINNNKVMEKPKLLGSCLYVNFTSNDEFGGGKFNETILEMLRELYNDVDTIGFPINMTRLKNLKNTLCGYLNGLNATVANNVIAALECKRYDMVFLASSNYGKLSKAIKAKFPRQQMCVLFNNIEYNFIRSQISVSPKPQLLLTLLATYFSEKDISKYADKIIVLNNRESHELHRLYNRIPDGVIPITLKDECDKVHFQDNENKQKSQQLKGVFVGSNFYANKHAVEWFSNNVAPHLNGVCIEIIGKGFENERQYERNNVRMVGTVDCVSEHYISSDFVIAPIFKGAGMKVKVAEAMMYGRTVIGTPEAFNGYEDVDRFGVICSTAEAFINSINSRKFTIGFNATARKIFLKRYEYGIVKEQLYNLLKV